MSCSHRASDLVVLVADATGATTRVRLCCARWWMVLGTQSPGAVPSPYQVWLDYGGQRVHVDTVAGGLHGTAMVAAGDDIFIQLVGMTPGSTAYLGVGR